MDDVAQLQQDVREGRITAERLVDLIVTLQRELQAARRRIEELEKKLGGSGTGKVAEPFSVRAEEQRQEARGQKPRQRKRPWRRGRFTTAEKIAQAQRTEKVFPVGVAPRRVRFPPHTLRFTTAGRIACSARQFVASIVGCSCPFCETGAA